jgi:aryl-alcohol dehydrogenase-like predicted oxidoreductase
VTRIGLGCVTFGREIGQDESFAILDYAWENGVRLFDTAEAYGGGESERILGRWMASRGVAGEAEVMTKVSFRFDGPGIREAALRSLERLGIGSVAYYLLHRWEATVPMEVQLDALQSLRAEHLIHYLGCSNFNLNPLRAALAIAKIDVLQNMYNLVARDLEVETMALCRAEGVKVVTFSPLAAGFLTGKYGREVPKGSRFDIIPGHRDIYFSDANFAVVDKLQALAAETGIPSVRLAMGWVLKNSGVDCVLVGARNTRQLENALECLRTPAPNEIHARMDAWM